MCTEPYNSTALHRKMAVAVVAPGAGAEPRASALQSKAAFSLLQKYIRGINVFACWKDLVTSD